MTLPLVLFLFSFLGFLHSTCSQFSNPQNLEVFYPFLPPPSPANPPNGSFFVSPPPPASPGHGSSSNNTVAKAVGITAAATFVIASLLFFFTQRYIVARRRQVVADHHTSERADHHTSERADHQATSAGANARFSRVGSKVKGMIVDENGLDVIYWRRLEEGSKGGGKGNGAFPKEESLEEERLHPIHEVPLLRGRSSGSHLKEVPLLRGRSSGSHLKGGQESQDQQGTNNFNVALSNQRQGLPSQRSTPPLPLPPGKQTPLPPPAPNPRTGPPPPPPPIPLKSSSPGPPPPPPPRAGAKAPSDPKGKQLLSTEAGEKDRGSNGQVKLKPLHWDKVNKNTDHSMVWDKISAGSFRVDDDLMEALFGYVATNRKSPKTDGSSTPKSNSPPTQVVILDPRKSQNTAIVIKSLSISRKEILDALTDGHGLDVDVLEKLVRIAPSKEEELQILEFQGDARKLADAESFLYFLLKAVPSAFSRFNAMYFRSSYDTEVRQFKEHLETLELGSRELKNRGLFMKLLEAILKAGNRMNAGTARGNAQAFKLSSLTKLSDVKSTDGKTTLLHFVVEEVVRSEGKKLVLNRSRSFSRSSSTNSTSSSVSESSTSEERDREYKMLGLPVVGGLSSEFSNVKKAAQIDYETFAGTLSSLSARVRDIKLTVARSTAAGESGGGFAKEMKAFFETAEQELNGLKQEEKRVMDLVKRTTDYYQPGAANDSAAHKLQLFVIIKDFLGMVDRVCIEVARSLQRKKSRGPSGSGSGSGSPTLKAPKAVRFPNLPAHFLSESENES